MTILLTLIGIIVFIFSALGSGFKSAWKRLMLFAVTGLIVDLFIVGVSLTATYVITL